MLSWLIFFLIIALVAVLLGFSRIVETAAGIAIIYLVYSWSCL